MNQPHFPYRDGDQAVLGPEVFASADGETIRWQGANYRRDHGQAATDELTAEEARALVDELGLDLYRAQDALAFVEECCAIAEREQKPITTADVREWLKGARCGRQLAADAVAAAARPAEFATVTDPAYLRQLIAQAIRDTPARYPDDIATAVMRVLNRHLEQVRQRLRLADELLATRDAELAAAKKTARGIGAWGVLQAIEQALPPARDDGPSVAECAEADRAHWNAKYDR